MELALIIIYLITLLYISVTDRFRRYATLIGVQGWLLFGISILQLHAGNWGELIFVIAETLIFKSIVVPYILFKVIRKTGINRVHAKAASIYNQLIFSVIALIGSVAIAYYIADSRVNMIFLGMALYALLSGMLLIVTHKRIFSHLVGFLVIENGVFLFTLAIGIEMPFLINLAILLDILISVLLLGMFLGKIGERMNDLDSDTLTTLKD